MPRTAAIVDGGSGGGRSGGGGAVIIAIVVAVAIIVISWGISVLIRFALSRSREFLADAGSAELTKNPDGLVRALRKIEHNATLDVPSRMEAFFIENPVSNRADGPVRDASVRRGAGRGAAALCRRDGHRHGEPGHAAGSAIDAASSGRRASTSTFSSSTQSCLACFSRAAPFRVPTTRWPAGPISPPAAMTRNATSHPVDVLDAAAGIERDADAPGADRRQAETDGRMQGHGRAAILGLGAQRHAGGQRAGVGRNGDARR